MRIILSLLLLFISSVTSFSNNVQITNVSITGQNIAEDFTMVEFDISWENSWRLIGGPNNWDAAWVFVKYRIGPGPWKHAWLNNTGHTYCGNAALSTGLLDTQTPFHVSTNPVMGIFIYRSSVGSGTFSCSNVQLKWNYGANGIPD